MYSHVGRFRVLEGAMPTVQKSLRIPDEVAKAIEEAAEASGRDFSTVANELIAEAVKMRRCPGVLFADAHPAEGPALPAPALRSGRSSPHIRALSAMWSVSATPIIGSLSLNSVPPSATMPPIPRR